MITSCRMSDVAAAAGVSVTTVSNVLNSPQKVKIETKARILAAIDRLGYVRNEQAYDLRKGARTSSRKHRGGEESGTTQDVSAGEPQGGIPHGIQIHGSSLPPQLLLGSRVGLASEGNVIAGGWVDMATPDGSAVWVWLEGGGGRRLIHAGDGIDLLILDADPDIAHAHETTNTNFQSSGISKGN
jgi:hypothetical protein